MQPAPVNFVEQIRELEFANETLRRNEQTLAAELENLQQIATQLITAGGVQPLYDRILHSAAAILRADFATLETLEPDRGPGRELQLLAHYGLSQQAAGQWACLAGATRSTCAEALRIGKRVAVPDVRDCPFLAASPDLQSYLDLGIVGAQTTPFYSRSRVLLGALSTYWRRPHALSPAESHALDVLARFAADLLERSRSEEELRECEERLRFAQQTAGIGTFEWNIETGMIVWSPQLEAIYGLPPGGFARTHAAWERAIHPDDRARTLQLVAESLETGNPVEAEWRISRPDGSIRWISGRWRVLKNSAGQALRIMGANLDVTDRKLMEEALRQSEERLRLAAQGADDAELTARNSGQAVSAGNEAHFRKMADAAPVMIWTSGPDKLCTFFNKGWLEFRGRTYEEELGNGWAEGVHPDDLARCYSTYSSAFDARANFQMEYRLLRADGEYRYIFDSGVPMFTCTNEFEGYIGSCIDITNLKRAQEESFHRQKLESIGVLAEGIAHDFNNLLGGILSHVQLIEDEIPPRTAVAEHLRVISGLGERASEIVHELTVYAGREPGGFEKVDPSALVEEMLELLKVSISKRAVLRTSLAKDLPPITARVSEIRQLVMNLITNASEAIGDGEGVISVTTALDPADSGFVRLEVSDTGCGIAEEQKSKIFDPFFTTKFAGRGLGLAVVQGVVRTHGGSIAVESSPGRGATFRILLPTASGPPDPSPDLALAPPAEPIAEGARAVLLIEDEETLRCAVAKTLSKRGFTILEAADGASAIGLLCNDQLRIDVILLDLTIPGVGSREVVEQARRLRPQTPIVITSAYSQDAVSRLGDLPQVAAYIRKPFRANQLAELLTSKLIVVERAVAPPQGLS